MKGIEFAFWALNDHYDAKGKARFHRKNTLVIAAGASNGGGMALRALEDDAEELIDGLVVTEPNIPPQDAGSRSSSAPTRRSGPRPHYIYDSMTLMSLYAACAAHAPGAAGTLLFGPQTPLGVNRCTSLRAKGLISGDTLADQAESARAKIREHGYAAAQDWGIASHDTLALWRSLQATYANAYGRFGIQDNVCGVSFAATDATLRPAPLADDAAKGTLRPQFRHSGDRRG